jgi:hypothetical protein
MLSFFWQVLYVVSNHFNLFFDIHDNPVSRTDSLCVSYVVFENTSKWNFLAISQQAKCSWIIYDWILALYITKSPSGFFSNPV